MPIAPKYTLTLLILMLITTAFLWSTDLTLSGSPNYSELARQAQLEVYQKASQSFETTLDSSPEQIVIPMANAPLPENSVQVSGMGY